MPTKATARMMGHMDRPDRNGQCKVCGGRIRHYPAFPARNAWAHLDRADWIDEPHDPEPTDESLTAAQA